MHRSFALVLRLPIDVVLPDFDSPDEVLGDDLFSHLPEGEGGRRWRALMTEAQVLLHNHSWNQQRAAQGQQPINSLWFWGGGVMPVSVSTPHARSRDALLQAWPWRRVWPWMANRPWMHWLICVSCALAAARQRCDPAVAGRAEAWRTAAAGMDFEDGLQFQLDRGQRWQFWKKPRQLHD